MIINNAFVMKKVYVIIDIENVAVKYKKEALQDFNTRLNKDGYEVFKIGMAAKDSAQLNVWKQMCLEVFEINLDNIKITRVAAGYDSADMAMSFIAGFWCKENENNKYPFVILSNDKIFKKTEIYIKAENIDCLEYFWSKEEYKSIKQPQKSLIFEYEKYPYGYGKCEISIPRLDVISHPNETDHPISYIPLPNIGEEFSLGIENNQSEQHICLDYWNQDKKVSMYPIHAYVGYYRGQLYVRSAKGFRRGDKSVEINNVIINSANGNRLLEDGDLLKIGKFVFKVAIPKVFSERKLQQNNSIDNIVKNTEIALHQWIRNKLSSISNNWWTDFVRDDIRRGCNERNEGRTEHSYNYTFIKDLLTIIKDNWDVFSTSLVPYYMSKKKCEKAFSHFIILRNKVMHPTRNELYEEEISFLKDFNSTITFITNKE